MCYNRFTMIENLPDNLNGCHIHFVGIKGTGMAALVEILFHAGAIITGSDVEERFYTDEILENLNIKPLAFSEKNITSEIQYVIYSSAYKKDKNPDLIEAVRKNIPCLLYTQALGSYSKKNYSCGICGVHGKTSTTGLTGTILKNLPLPFQVLAGSVINSFGNHCTFTSENINQSKNRIFVAETCEYQKHFMSFFPKKIILTSVEPDHQDFYPTYNDILNAFVEYVLKLPQNGTLIFCADDKGAFEVYQKVKVLRPDIDFIPYGENASGDFHLNFLGIKDEKNNFEIQFFKNSGFKEFSLSVPGRHEVLDACAAVCLVCSLLKEFGFKPEDFYSQISSALLTFSGGKRRSEIVGKIPLKNNKNVIVIDDYAHHPTAIRTTLQGFKEFYKGRRIIVDFMSHTYSRTLSLLKEFASSFACADEIYLHKIYSSARENPSDFDISGKTLYDEVLKTGVKKENVHYFEEPLSALPSVIKSISSSQDDFPDGFLFVTMGAGDNWKLGKALIEKF